ncbi:DUF3489 domain-containing protein [Neoroseomonas oryzicola]|uniref:DUF3489 domain-containing protein n=1 Tax=Neoroseomonas oryzicola TaxID=535904 RepID=A0A9X9WE86_9PROT|nr:DUF3489 domain-containing protein [Neoroseomonas oryzicola]NKE17918.1 DUF3489 domain-containing protein [Neoroseomonas oryzicola]
MHHARPPTPRLLRSGTKQEAALTLLRRDEGMTIAEVIEATGWNPTRSAASSRGSSVAASLSRCWSASGRSGPASRARKAPTRSTGSLRRSARPARWPRPAGAPQGKGTSPGGRAHPGLDRRTGE